MVRLIGRATVVVAIAAASVVATVGLAAASGGKATVRAHLLALSELPAGWAVSHSSSKNWLIFYGGPGATQVLAKAAVGAFPKDEVLSVKREGA